MATGVAQLRLHDELHSTLVGSSHPGGSLSGAARPPKTGSMNQADTEIVNGIDCSALRRMIRQVAQEPDKGKVKLQVVTAWKGALQSESQASRLEIAGEPVRREFAIRMDEPPELLGHNTGPSPEEMLVAAFNASLVASYVSACSLAGIVLEKLTIETKGDLDLRGALGLDASIRPGFAQLSYVVRIHGNGTPEQFQRIHEAVLATSPNRWNLANAINLRAELIVESPMSGDSPTGGK
jgi:uncharacterized OsmC-like protein